MNLISFNSIYSSIIKAEWTFRNSSWSVRAKSWAFFNWASLWTRSLIWCVTPPPENLAEQFSPKKALHLVCKWRSGSFLFAIVDVFNDLVEEGIYVIFLYPTSLQNAVLTFLLQLSFSHYGLNRGQILSPRHHTGLLLFFWPVCQSSLLKRCISFNLFHFLL